MSGNGAEAGSNPLAKEFRLDRLNGKLMGVCSGLGTYFGVDRNLIRIGFVLGTLLGAGSLLLVYLAIALIAD